MRSEGARNRLFDPHERGGGQLGSPRRPGSNLLAPNDSALCWGALLVIGLTLLVLARVAPVQELLGSLRAWLDGLGPWGLVAFIAIYILAALAFVPGSLLTAASGALFGLAWGTAAVSAASTGAAAIAFVAARHFLRETVARKAAAHPRFRAIDRAIGRGGWRVVALLRLSPAVPFSLGNYLFGLTAVRFWPYVLVSWLTMLPGTFLYVYLGYVGREGLTAVGGSSPSSPGQWALLVVGLVATGVVIVYVTRLARRALLESEGIDSCAPGSEARGASGSEKLTSFPSVLPCDRQIAGQGGLRVAEHECVERQCQAAPNSSHESSASNAVRGAEPEDRSLRGGG